MLVCACVCVWLWYGDGQACNLSETNQRGIQVTNRRTDRANGSSKIAHQKFSVVYAIFDVTTKTSTTTTHGESIWPSVKCRVEFRSFHFLVCAFSSLRRLTRHHVTAIPINRFVDVAKKAKKKKRNIVRFSWKFYLWVHRDWMEQIRWKRKSSVIIYLYDMNRVFSCPRI